jgi:hypothetical protein
MKAALPAIGEAAVNAIRIQGSVGATNGGLRPPCRPSPPKRFMILGFTVHPAQIPDILLAPGSAAGGALAGLLAPSPGSKR